MFLIPILLDNGPVFGATLSTPPDYSPGSWGAWSTCPTGSFFAAFRNKVSFKSIVKPYDAANLNVCYGVVSKLNPCFEITQLLDSILIISYVNV